MTTLAFICFAISKHDCLHDFLPSISNQNQNTPILRESEERKQNISPLPSYIFHRLSFQFPASRAAALVATLASVTLGDVLLARCSGSSLRVNLLPTHLVGELAAELGGGGLLSDG